MGNDIDNIESAIKIAEEWLRELRNAKAYYDKNQTLKDYNLSNLMGPDIKDGTFGPYPRVKNNCTT